MTEFISNIFSSIFGNNVILATILIAMVPIIELRGAIPFATNTGFWGTHALTSWTAFGYSLLGSSLIVPIIALIFVPLMKFLKKTKIFGKLASAIENRIKSKSEKIEGANEKSKRFSLTWWKKVLAIFLFVAIPLPLTGVWTGTLVAVFIGLDYLTTCITVITGNAVAALLITLILEFFPALNNYLFYIFILLVLLVVAYELIRALIKRKKNPPAPVTLPVIREEDEPEEESISFKQWWAQVKGNNFLKDLLAVFAIFVLSLIIITPILARGYINGHDSTYHFSFIRALNEGWQEGNFTKRIFGTIGQDFGYGSGLFYSKIPAGIAVIFINILHLDVVGAIALELFLIFSLSGIITYFFAKRVFKNRFFALITAICYTAFPYFITNVYIRFAFSEIFIMLALPMIIWGIYELVENKNYKLFFPLFTMGYIISFLTHVALSIFITIFVGIYLLVNIKRFIKDKLYFAFIASCFICVVCVLTFYIPMILNLGITEQSAMGNSGTYLWKSALSIFYSNTVFVTTIFSFIVYIPFAITFFTKQKTRFTKILFTFATLALGLVSPLFPWPILGFSPFNNIQFAWRIYSIASIPLSFAVGYMAKELSLAKNLKLKKAFIPALATLSVLIVACMTAIPFLYQSPKLTSSSISYESALDPQKGLGGGIGSSGIMPITIPDGATREYSFTRGNNLVQNSDFEIKELANYQTHSMLIFSVSPNAEGNVQLKIPYECLQNASVNRYYFDRTVKNKIKDAVEISDIDGLLNLKIENSLIESQVIIKYEKDGALDKYLKANPFEFLTVSGNASASNFVKYCANNYKIDFSVSEESVVELPTYFYKGYTLTFTTLSGEVQKLSAIHGEHGFIEVKLTESGTLHVEFNPNYIRYSNLLSFFGFDLFLIALGIIFLVPRKYFALISDWIDKFLESHKTIAEIIRFLVVGAISTVIDMFVMGIVMYLMQMNIYESFLNVFINSPNPSTLATIIGTTVGSIAGMIVSFFLSVIFVFNEKGESKSIKGFIVFALLTAIGLGINMLGTYIGYTLLHINQWITKIIMIIVVLIYNYISKRLILFKNKHNKKEKTLNKGEAQ